MKTYVLLFFLLPTISFAQFDSENDVLEHLSGNQYKLWFFVRYDVNMGGNNACQKGKAYTFHKSKKVVIKECVDGIWKEKEYQYSLEKESPYDWWIKFNNERYYLVMLNRGEFLETKLRTIQSLYGKIDESEDIILKHYPDD
jgi:hypothetical protein